MVWDGKASLYEALGVAKDASQVTRLLPPPPPSPLLVLPLARRHAAGPSPRHTNSSAALA